MNQRDRLYVQRESIAWGRWNREGQTFPNTLGYKSTTVEYALMRGETGGDCNNSSKVPLRFNGDKGVEITERIYCKLDGEQQLIVALIFIGALTEQRTADMINLTRHQVRKQLNVWYELLLAAHSTDKSATGIASG